MNYLKILFKKKKKKILSFHNSFNEFPIINNNNKIQINQNYIQGNLHLQNIKKDIHSINKELDIKKKNENQQNQKNQKKSKKSSKSSKSSKSAKLCISSKSNKFI